MLKLTEVPEQTVVVGVLCVILTTGVAGAVFKVIVFDVAGLVDGFKQFGAGLAVIFTKT